MSFVRVLTRARVGLVFSFAGLIDLLDLLCQIFANHVLYCVRMVHSRFHWLCLGLRRLTCSVKDNCQEHMVRSFVEWFGRCGGLFGGDGRISNPRAIECDVQVEHDGKQAPERTKFEKPMV